jgi:hypothetical protein
MYGPDPALLLLVPPAALSAPPSPQGMRISGPPPPTPGADATELPDAAEPTWEAGGPPEHPGNAESKTGSVRQLTSNAEGSARPGCSERFEGIDSGIALRSPEIFRLDSQMSLRSRTDQEALLASARERHDHCIRSLSDAPFMLANGSATCSLKRNRVFPAKSRRTLCVIHRSR